MSVVAGLAPVPAPAAMRCVGVVLTFGGVRALNQVSFSLAPGEVVGLIGPNGAGKTSLINCLTGFYRPDEGSIQIAGQEVRGRSTRHIAGLGISRTFQQAADLTGLGASDVMMLGRERFLTRGMVYYTVSPRRVRRQEDEARTLVLAIAEELGIADYVGGNTQFEDLPYGVRKLVDLGRALACEPQVLFMDEPAAGLSDVEKARMIEVIRRIQQTRGIAQLLVDHDVDFVSAVSSRLVVLDAGTLIAQGPVAEVLALPVVIDSYIGREIDDLEDGTTDLDRAADTEPAAENEVRS